MEYYRSPADQSPDFLPESILIELSPNRSFLPYWHSHTVLDSGRAISPEIKDNDGNTVGTIKINDII